ncbi:carbon monoxide dehydrogenase, partial [Chloroflexota bacterium]
SNHSVKGVRTVARIRDLATDLKLMVKKQLIVINSAPPTLDPLVTDELSKLGIDPINTIPLDKELYEYDLKLKPLLDLPDTSKAVRAINDFMTELLKTEEIHMKRG